MFRQNKLDFPAVSYAIYKLLLPPTQHRRKGGEGSRKGRTTITCGATGDHKNSPRGGLTILLSSSSDYLRNWTCLFSSSPSSASGWGKYEQIGGHYFWNYYDWIIKGIRTPSSLLLRQQQQLEGKGEPFDFRSLVWSGWRWWLIRFNLFIRSGFLQLIFNLRHLISGHTNKRKRRESLMNRDASTFHGFWLDSFRKQAKGLDWNLVLFGAIKVHVITGK